MLCTLLLRLMFRCELARVCGAWTSWAGDHGGVMVERSILLEVLYEERGRKKLLGRKTPEETYTAHTKHNSFH